jgi:hypothetical protein
MPHPKRRDSSKQRQLLLAAEDELQVTEALRARWPQVIFVPSNYDDEASLGLGGSGFQSGPKPELRRLPGLTAPAGVDGVRVWLPPDNWRPVWKAEDCKGDWRGDRHYVIDNEPELECIYNRSLFGGAITPWDSTAGRIWAWYERSNKEHLAFLNAVWRLVAKFTTNTFDIVYHDTGHVRAHAQKQFCWAGFHALDWARADPVRRMDQNMRPVGSPALPVPRQGWRAAHCEHPRQASDYEEYRELCRTMGVDPDPRGEG